MEQYNFNKLCDPDRLAKEISESAIVTAQDHIETSGSPEQTRIFFKAELSSGDEDILNALIDAHVNTPLPEAPKLIEVVTQFEKDDKILKLFTAKAAVDSETGIATLLIKVPGNPAQGDGRYIAGGSSWFSEAHDGDQIIEVSVVDVDNILGYGANTTLRSWHDDEADSENQGWFFPITRPILEVEPIGGYGFINSGLYMKIAAKKAANHNTGNLYINLFWAKGE